MEGRPCRAQRLWQIHALAAAGRRSRAWRRRHHACRNRRLDAAGGPAGGPATGRQHSAGTGDCRRPCLHRPPCIGRLLRGEGSVEDASAADWSLENRLTDALTRAGLAGIAPSHPFGTLSGGQRARLAFARVLQEAPDILLLDEPTNNLDAGGRTLIAELLRGWRGCVIVASHDRALLACVDRIVEIANGRAISFGGPWPVFAAARAARLEAARSALGHAEQASRRRHRARDQG